MTEVTKTDLSDGNEKSDGNFPKDNVSKYKFEQNPDVSTGNGSGSVADCHDSDAINSKHADESSNDNISDAKGKTFK